jgi:hypothetical protein
MKLSKPEAKKVYDSMQKRRKKILRRSLLLAVFVFGVNIYAWFIFLNQSRLEVHGNVASWNVTFYDGTEEVQDLVINEQLYPGMDDYNKTLTIVNDGEVIASFEYTISDLKILGKTVDTSNQTTAINSLQNDYPFIFTMSSDKTTINAHDSMNFSVDITWDYQDGGLRPYYRLTSVYDYTDEFDYYRLNSGTFEKVTNVNAETFPSLRDSLYLQRDDADTYFGEQCGVYQRSTGKACVEYKITVVVKQKDD